MNSKAVEKPVVYRWADVDEANRHFKSLDSWFRATAADRRIITGDAHDDYVHSEEVNGYVAGSVPRRLLVATSEDYDALKASVTE